MSQLMFKTRLILSKDNIVLIVIIIITIKTIKVCET